MSLKEMTTQNLVTRLQALMSMSADTLLEGSQILVELESRAIQIAVYTKGLWKHYRDIAAGRLDPGAVMHCLGAQSAVTYLTALPAEQQLAVAKGAPVKTVDHDEAGRIHVIEKPIHQMTKREIDTAFDDTGFRPIKDQKRILSARGNDVRRGRKSAIPVDIRADTATEELVIGQIRVKVAELEGPLRALGFEVRRASAKRRNHAETENRTAA